ncbi:MAG: hypothetical protein GX442_22795 [Candidatus Riflebacteria bacterium]|nr:hypothetical protein [Candidatus Riflebacteria bacterium]
MKRINRSCLLPVLGLTAVLWAGSPAPAVAQQVIQLKDQTVIRGQVVEMTNNTYRIKTPSLGEVKIPADQVMSIVNESVAPPAGAPVPAAPRAPAIREGHRPTPAPAARPPATGRTDDLGSQQKEVNTRVQSMMMDGGFLNKVTGLGDSSEMQDILGDPEVMNAIQSGDYEYLMKNEKMQRLMDSQDIQDLLGDVEP